MYCNLVELSFVSYECMVVSLNYDVKLNLKYCSTDTFLYKVRTKLIIQKKQRHSKSREMPLPIYFGLCIHIHTMTKSEKIICILDSHGISVSYEHVIKLENVAHFCC